MWPSFDHLVAISFPSNEIGWQPPLTERSIFTDYTLPTWIHVIAHSCTGFTSHSALDNYHKPIETDAKLLRQNWHETWLTCKGSHILNKESIIS